MDWDNMISTNHTMVPKDVHVLVKEIDNVIGKLHVNNTFILNNLTMEYYKLSFGIDSNPNRSQAKKP